MNNIYKSSSVIKSVETYLKNNLASDRDKKDISKTDLANIAKAVFVFLKSSNLSILNNICFENQQEFIDEFESDTGFNLLQENYQEVFTNHAIEHRPAVTNEIFLEFVCESYNLNKFTPQFLTYLDCLIDSAIENLQDETIENLITWESDKYYWDHQARCEL